MSGAWWRRRPARIPAWLVDAGWAVAVAATVTIAIRVAREPGARPPDLLAHALGWTIAALLPARRRWPLAVLAASFAALQLYCVLGYPGISAAVPLAVALYTAGAAGHLRWAMVIAGWFVAGPIIVRIFLDPEPALAVLGEVVRDGSLWLAILLLGALPPPASAAGGRAGPVGAVAGQHGGRWPARPHGRPCRGRGRAGLGDAGGRGPPQVP
jgi:hypothetical protein